MGDVEETKTTIKLKKGALKHVVNALVVHNLNRAKKLDIFLTKIVKLAKVFVILASVETTTTTPLRNTVLKPAKINQ